MKKSLLISIILLLNITMFAQTSNNKYENDWKQVEGLETESLPQSAMAKVDEILNKAIIDHNNIQVIKALIYQNKYKRTIDWSDNEGLLKDLERLVTQTDNIAEKALLYSMLAELYTDYYRNDYWNINQRTIMSGFIPEDIKEWSQNIFTDKIIEYLDLSLQNVTALKGYSTKQYEDIILLGNESQRYYPTLYDFLALRSIGISKLLGISGYREFDPSEIGVDLDKLILPAKDYVKLDIRHDTKKQLSMLLYYKTYLQDLLSRNLIPTVILMDIDRIEYLAQRSYQLSGKKLYDAYQNLYFAYQENEAAVEIIAKITDSSVSGFVDRQDANRNIYEWLKKSIEKYPDYYAIDILKNKLINLESPELSVQGKSVLYPESPAEAELIYKNTQLLDDIVFYLYKVENGKYKKLNEYPLSLISKTTYNADTLTLDLGKLTAGKYSLTNVPVNDWDVKKDLSISRYDFIVSSLISFSRNSKKDEYEIFVVDRISGKPVKDALVQIFEYNNRNSNNPQKLLTSLKTNDLGLALYKDIYTDKKNNYYVAGYKVILDADSCLNMEYLYNQNYRWSRGGNSTYNETINIFTDRAIYRPGQTIYFKAIISDNDNHLVDNDEFSVELYNANNELVAEKELKTNEFGSLSGEFILPQTGLLGQYRLKIVDAEVYFNVEEYKRPTFEVTFDNVDKTYRFGEEITIKGNVMNFSGVSLQDTDVRYSISREQIRFWWQRGNSSHFTDGVVKTGTDGSFKIVFTPEPGDEKSLIRPLNDKNIYSFNIQATVTDINGETQSETFRIFVGNLSMFIDIDMPDKIEKTQNDTIKIGARNLQGQPIETSGTYVLYKLNDNDSIADKIFEGTFNTGEQSELRARMKSLSSGKYRLFVRAKDNNSNEVEERKDFILYAYNDKKPPVKTNSWVISKNILFDNNNPAEVIFGTSQSDAYVLYQLSNDSVIFERSIIKLSNANRLFKIPYKTEYGKNLNVTFTYVKNAELYNENILISKKEDVKDTSLKLKLDVFRDKLRPGDTETWTISVKDMIGNPADAEILASMYDISLDKLMSYRAWFFNRSNMNDIYISPVNYNISSSGSYYPINFILNFPLNYKPFPARTIDVINWFGYIFNRGNNILAGYINPTDILNDNVIVGYGVQRKAASSGGVGNGFAEVTESASLMPSADQSQTLRFVPPTISDDENIEVLDDNSIPQIRQNFNETAFFYPYLRTNEKGETLLSFNVPESNTTWRFRALAHDKEARAGILEQLIITRKELMVTPNMPRFLRQGDKTSISTKISNLSENTISGNVSIEFFDPLTEKMIDLGIENQMQSFSVRQDASVAVDWLFNVPSDLDLIGCRIIARSGTFSDGEQHILSVLPNRMLVTETLPINITNKDTDTFILDKLYDNKSVTLENYRLTLEYASNPAWYAVQALPSLSNPTNENAVNWFASYYVNTLGTSIVRQYPKVANMIKSWLKQGGDKETLISKLQKDEELKAVLLEETPWILDAKNETEQMQRLSLLFDLNNTKQSTDVATRKLSELMTPDGGWAWYKGLNTNRSITQYILYGYAKLQQTGQVEYSEEIKRMQMQALKYIDGEILNDYNNLKKNNKDLRKINNLSTSQLEYAFVRSFYRDIPISQEAREAERFYTDVASRNWTKLNLYERAIFSVLLMRNGDDILVGKIVKSLREHAVNNKKLGMYWPNNRSSVFMSMSAVSIHTFLMDALEENGASKEEIDAMKHWLIMQKQTQVWESTHSTIDAISAILGTGSDWFAGEIQPAVIKVGDIKVEPENKELGTGYFKQTWNKPEINSNMAKVDITTSTTEPAYGALYWQYYEEIGKITAQIGDLNIEKHLFKEIISPAGNTLVMITEKNPLSVGDKVVMRLTIRADRDMEFVQVKDMRAPCFEPVQTISGIQWTNGLLYYQMPKDASTNFYFDHLPKGTYVIEYPVYVNRTGEYSNGITTIQCMYAPQYSSHTQGIKVTVKDSEQ